MVASARNMIKKSWHIFEIRLTSHIDGYDKLKLIAELHIKISIYKTAVSTRKQQLNNILNAKELFLTIVCFLTRNHGSFSKTQSESTDSNVT